MADLQETDQFGNPIKKKTLPMAQPNQMTQLSPSALNNFGAVPSSPVTQPIAPTAQGVLQGNTNILAKAQTDVLNQPQQSNLQKLTTQKAEEFVKNPMGDFNAEKNKQQRLEGADTNWAKTFEAQRQQYGNLAGSGLLQQNMLQNALQHNVERGNLESQIDQDNYQRYLDSITKAIQTGQGQTQSNENIFSQRLQNLGNVRGMAEGERTQVTQSNENALDRAFKLQYLSKDQEGQKALTELKGNIDKGMLMTTQDFAASQSALDRAFKDAQQRNDINAQKEITAMKGEIEAQAQKAQQQWASSERVATQGWQSSERLSSQEFENANKVLDRQLAEASQKRDLASQMFLQNSKNALALKMQTNDMNQQEKMAYLGSQLEEAKANNDVNRQKSIIEFQTAQDLAKIEKEQGHDVAMLNLKQKIDDSARSQDFLNTQVLQEQKMKFEAVENDKNRALDEARLALQGKQIDMQGQQMTFDQIQKGIEAGQIDPKAGAEAIRVAAANYMITIKPPDPTQAYKAIDAEIAQQKYQWGQLVKAINPEYIAADGKTLTKTGELAFAQHNSPMTGSTIGETVGSIVKGKDIISQIKASGLTIDGYSDDAEMRLTALEIPKTNDSTKKEKVNIIIGPDGQKYFYGASPYNDIYQNNTFINDLNAAGIKHTLHKR